MERPKIVRLYGRADHFDIEFQKRGSRWTCQVPPDVTDGVYAVTLTAVNASGETGHWTGELFMVNGLCHLKIRQPRFGLWIRLGTTQLKLSKAQTRLIIRKGHRYGAS